MRQYPLDNGATYKEINNPFNNKVPQRFVLAIVENSAFNGRYDQDTFAYQPAGIEYIKQIVDGEETNKAVRVAAEAQILIDDPNTPAALKEPVVKEMLKEKNMLNDKLRQGPSVAMTAPGVPQPPVDDDKMDGLQERLLKELVKSINANTQSIVPQITQTPLTVKKEEPKPKKKRKQTEVERLKEFGLWEPWEKRGYDPYQTFQDDEDQYAPSTSQGKGKKGKGKSKKKKTG